MRRRPLRQQVGKWARASHFQARFSGAEVRVDITDLSVLTGALPRAEQRVLMQWAAVHQEALMRFWELARNGQPHEPIAPTMTKEA